MSETVPGAMPERMPVASEEKAIHGGARDGILWKHWPLALARVAEMACYVLAVRIGQSLRRVRWTATDGGPCLEALKRDGVFAYRLSPAGKQRLVDAAKSWFARLEASREAIAQGTHAYCDNQLNTTRRNASQLYGTVEHVLGEAGMLSAVRDYLGCRAELRSVTLQINDQWDRSWRAHFEDRGLTVPPTAFFHIDNTYGVVKAIFYLSEVGETNGPFGYVSGTHRIKVGRFEALMLRAVDIWIDMHPQERHLFAALPRLLRRKAKFGDDIRSGDEQGRWLVDHERVMTSKDGDVFVFDVKGIHRGGMVRRGERRVIQVMMS
jgi:hypothetical protein